MRRRCARAWRAAWPTPAHEVRERAVEVLTSAGRLAIPQVQEQLNAGDPHSRKMAAVVLARIEPHQYAALVQGPILDSNLLAIYRNLSCLQALAGWEPSTSGDSPGRAVILLRRALAQRNAALLDEIFYLLATIQDPDAVKTIAHSLLSPQPEVRANAIEALESLTAPADGRSDRAAVRHGRARRGDGPEPSASLASLARKTWDISIPTPAAALRALLSPGDGPQGDASDAWQRTLAAAALAELSAAVDPLSQAEIAELLDLARADPDAGVRARQGELSSREAARRSDTMLRPSRKSSF